MPTQVHDHIEVQVYRDIPNCPCGASRPFLRYIYLDPARDNLCTYMAFYCRACGKEFDWRPDRVTYR